MVNSRTTSCGASVRRRVPAHPGRSGGTAMTCVRSVTLDDLGSSTHDSHAPRARDTPSTDNRVRLSKKQDPHGRRCLHSLSIESDGSTHTGAMARPSSRVCRDNGIEVPRCATCPSSPGSGRAGLCVVEVEAYHRPFAARARPAELVVRSQTRGCGRSEDNLELSSATTPYCSARLNKWPCHIEIPFLKGTPKDRSRRQHLQAHPRVPEHTRPGVPET